MKNADIGLGPPALPLDLGQVASLGRRAADFVSLTKPRLNFLVVVTATVGYYLGSDSGLRLTPLVETVLGTALVAGGAAGLNQVYERSTDGLMWRTRARPLPAQRISATEATVFSSGVAAIGLVMLAVGANLLAATLALVTLTLYNGVYTPMKRRSRLATFVGAVPGALPPMIGWAAARGALTAEAWALFGIVFLWQIPHFMAIAWMYRDDFHRAGFPLLPVIEPDGRSTASHALFFGGMLVPVSLAPFLLGLAGSWYASGALAGSLALVGFSLAFALDRTTERARRLFLASITYLPLLWALLIADRVR